MEAQLGEEFRLVAGCGFHEVIKISRRIVDAFNLPPTRVHGVCADLRVCCGRGGDTGAGWPRAQGGTLRVLSSP